MPLHVERLDGGPLLVVDAGGRVPVAAVCAWFRGGAAVEGPSELGAAHFIEHLSFRAPPGGEEPAARFEAMGGSANAWTSPTETVWEATVPAARAAEALGLLLDMAARPVFDAEAVDRERGVILEELRGALDDPGTVLGLGVEGRYWASHPHGRSVLGSRGSISELDPRGLRGFHRRWYRPDLLVVSVAGPVDPAPLRTVLEEAVAAWPRSRGAVPLLPVPPPAPGPRSGPVVVERGFEERLLDLRIALPPLGHPDEPALDLLAACLGDGSSSMLSTRLHHELDLVSDVGAALVPDVVRDTLLVEASLREGRVLDAVAEIGRLLAEVARFGPGMADLRRARAGVLAERIALRETVEGRAWQRAWNAARLDDPRADEAYQAALERVTLADLRRVARAWLDPDRAVVGVLCPPGEVDGRRLSRAFRRHWRTVRSAAPPRAPDGPLVRDLANGGRLVVLPDEGAELVAVTVLGAGGALAETPEEAGVAAAWSEVVVRGAGPHDAVDFAAAVEERAASMSAWSGRSTAGLRLVVPAADQRVGLELLGWCLREPRFDAREVERVRGDLLEAIALRDDDVASAAIVRAWAGLFPGHPWGRPPEGTAEGVERLAPDGLRAFHERVIRGRNLVVAVVGAVDPDEVARLLDRELAAVPAGAPFPADPPPALAPGKRRHRLASPRPGAPAMLVRAFRGVGLADPLAPAVRVLEAALGGAGGGTGRLWTALREELGLAYDVSVVSEAGVGAGAFICSALVDPARRDRARRAMDATLAALAADPPDAEEVARLGRSLAEGAVAGLQRASTMAWALAMEERFGRGAARWREVVEAPARVTPEEVRAAIDRVLRRDRSVLVEVEPAAGAPRLG